MNKCIIHRIENCAICMIRGPKHEPSKGLDSIRQGPHPSTVEALAMQNDDIEGMKTPEREDDE